MTSRRRVAFGFLALLATPAAAWAQRSPVGLWRVVDDNTGQERGLIRIFASNGMLYGGIERIFDPAQARLACTNCNDDRRGKPLIGLDILRGMRPDGSGGWAGGEILDPETGTTYRASLHLAENGRKLIVRGYVLLSMLGRTQTWIRQE